MAKYNIAEAKTRFSELVQKAMLGEEIIIAKDNKAVARLVALDQTGKGRVPGTAGGEIWMSEDFDDTPADFKDYR